jgi:anti-sigma factor RsiW
MNTAPLSCAELVEIVTDYLENAMSPELRRRFDEHLAQCDGCTEYVQQIRETIRAVGSVSEESLSEPGRQALLEAFRDWRPVPTKRRRWHRPRRGPTRD